jgi:hypothetical protein
LSADFIQFDQGKIDNDNSLAHRRFWKTFYDQTSTGITQYTNGDLVLEFNHGGYLSKAYKNGAVLVDDFSNYSFNEAITLNVYGYWF